jgi:crossover junction endonuclease EME1
MVNSNRADSIRPSERTGNAFEHQGYGSGSKKVDSSKVSTVVTLGFTESQAIKALSETNNDTARAIHWLVEHSEEKDDSGAAGRREPAEGQAQVKPKPRPSPRKPVAWDPISSSAPYSNAIRSSPSHSQTLQRSRSEIICLDDSDDAASGPPQRIHSRVFLSDDLGSELDFKSPVPKDKSAPFKFDDSDLNSDAETKSDQIPKSRAISKPSPVSKGRPEAFRFDDSDSDVLGLGSSGSDGPDHLAELKAEKRRAPGRNSTTASRMGIASKSRTNATKKTPEELARERITRESDKLRAKQAREAEKERKAKEKLLAKEEKAAEKIRAAALAEVNKKRTDKKVSTPEMIVDLPDSFNKKKHGDVEVMLKDIDVEYHFYTSPVDNVVKWRRKVRARYNQSLGHWEPISLRIEEEKHAMVIVEASHLVDLILATNDNVESNTLERHVMEINSNFKDHKLIYLIQGLSTWMSANRNLRRRHFESAVNNLDAASSTSAVATSRRKKTASEPSRQYIDENLIEEALLRLQVHHQVLVHHTKTGVETSAQIAIFTQQLSTLPYRRLRDDLNAAAASFCMESGQVKVGDGTRDTYARMLQEINRITAPIAYGIMGEFESVGDLVRGMESGGPLRLEDVRKCVDREGTVGDDARRIGPSVSKRVWGIFTGRDEGSMNV